MMKQHLNGIALFIFIHKYVSGNVILNRPLLQGAKAPDIKHGDIRMFMTPRKAPERSQPLPKQQPSEVALSQELHIQEDDTPDDDTFLLSQKPREYKDSAVDQDQLGVFDESSEDCLRVSVPSFCPTSINRSLLVFCRYFPIKKNLVNLQHWL